MGLEGGIQREMTPEDKIRMLNAQIAELEKRRNNIQSEVQVHYQRYKNELDGEHNRERIRLEEEYTNRNALLDKREAAIKGRENNLASREVTVKAEQEGLLNSLRTKNDEVDKERAELRAYYEKLVKERDVKLEAFALEKNKLNEKEENLRQEKQLLINIQQNIGLIEKRNKETEDRLEKELADIKEKKVTQEYFAEENKKKEEELLDRENKIKSEEIRIDNYRREIEINLESSRNQKAANEDTAQDLAVKHDAADKRKEELEKLSQYLQNLRDNLNELDRTLNERERYLKLKDGTISEKIKILQELREADQKK